MVGCLPIHLFSQRLGYWLCLVALAQTAALPLLGQWSAALSPFHGHVVVGAANQAEAAALLRTHDHFVTPGSDHDHDHHPDHHHAPVTSRPASPLGGPRVVFVAGGPASRLWSLMALPDLNPAWGALTLPAAPQVREVHRAAWTCPASRAIPPLLPPPRAV